MYLCIYYMYLYMYNHILCIYVCINMYFLYVQTCIYVLLSDVVENINIDAIVILSKVYIQLSMTQSVKSTISYLDILKW